MRKETIDFSILDEAKRCALELAKGGVILYPAETLWGLGCDASDISSIERIHELKERPSNKTFITLVSSYRMLQNVVAEIPVIAEEILELSEEPLTIIYPKAQPAFKHLASADGRIAVRMIEQGFANLLIEKLRKPLISTSANISGETNSGLYFDIPEQIVDQVDCIANPDLPYEMTEKPSKLMKVDLDGRIEILR